MSVSRARTVLIGLDAAAGDLLFEGCDHGRSLFDDCQAARRTEPRGPQRGGREPPVVRRRLGLLHGLVVGRGVHQPLLDERP